MSEQFFIIASVIYAVGFVVVGTVVSKLSYLDGYRRGWHEKETEEKE